MYTARGPLLPSEPSLLCWACSDDAIAAAGLVMLRFCSHAESAAVASARKAKCFVMKRNLPRVVDDSASCSGSNAAVRHRGCAAARYERLLILLSQLPRVLVGGDSA